MTFRPERFKFLRLINLKTGKILFYTEVLFGPFPLVRGGIKCWWECKANERRGLLFSHYTCGVQLDNNNNKVTALRVSPPSIVTTLNGHTSKYLRPKFSNWFNPIDFKSLQPTLTIRYHPITWHNLTYPLVTTCNHPKATQNHSKPPVTTP